MKNEKYIRFDWATKCLLCNKANYGVLEGFLTTLLDLPPFQRQKFNVDAVSDLYSEYYILKVNDFNKVAKSPLEEWIYYLNTGEISDGATAPGLDG